MTVLNSKFYISEKLAGWLEVSQSRSVAVARDSGFGRRFPATSVTAAAPIDQGIGAANG
jgi:hypothetical protein